MKFLIVLAVATATVAFPLASEEAIEVQTAWNAVKDNQADMLYAVFKDYPEIQDKFPAFASQDLEAIKNSEAFTSHAKRIFGQLSSIFDQIGVDSNEEEIKASLERIGETHRNRNATKEDFGKFRNALTKYVASRVTWNENLAAAWNKTFDGIFEIIFSKLAE
uniref:Globin n=1 Tax=Polypedilum nubifer TaxID=54969 RepID=V5YMJ3_9DIPT|nr:globin [Polypedilum nubifer]